MKTNYEFQLVPRYDKNEKKLQKDMILTFSNNNLFFF